MAFGPRTRSPSKIEVMRRYDAIAEGYDQLYRKEQLAKFKLADFRRLGFTLDCGCGTGLLMAELPTEPMTVGLDLSTGMLKEAKRKLGGKYHLIRGDALYPPLRASTFINVYSFTVVDEVQAKAMVRAVSRLLTEDGKAVLSASKKAFTLNGFKAIVKASGLKPVKIMDQRHVKDYVVVCRKNAK